MKWCIEFPEETVLVIRPSLKRICLNISPAANLLSVLLYRHSIRKEASEDAKNLNSVKRGQGEKEDQDVSYRIYRKQAQIVTDCCGELTERTLHDTAIPTLQMLGYLDVEEMPGCNCYILHMSRINEAMGAYRKGVEALKLFYKSMPQLETFLIEVRYEKIRINKNNFVSQLEKVLIGNRKSSNCQRGRKGKPEADAEGDFSKGRLREDSNTDYKKEERENVVSPIVENNAPSISSLVPSTTENDSQPALFPETAIPIVATTPKRTPKAKSSIERVIDPRQVYWQDRINGWRGGPLENKLDRNVNEPRQIRELIGKYSDAQVDAIIRRMLTYWKYQDSPRSIGAKEILKESGPFSGILKDNKMWPDETVKLENPVEVTATIIQFPVASIQPKPVMPTTLETLHEKLKTLRQGSREYSEVVAAILMLREKQKVSM